MIKDNLIGILTALFIVVAVLLNIFSGLYISVTNIFGYSFIVIGAGLAYSNFIQNKKIILFIGSATFLSGVLLILLESFDLNIHKESAVPIILLVGGFSLLMTYLTDFAKLILLIFSLICLAGGLTILVIQDSFIWETFGKSFVPVFSAYWIIILITLLIMFIMVKDK